jgi:HAE1 family hydrophobic/amphiphilic exporter-1
VLFKERIVNIPKLSIERPAFISSVIALILILGVMSYSKLGVDQFPDVNFPFVVVMTSYSGAGPEEIETLISKPLEDELSTAEGLKKITSVSQDSFSTLICEFTLETPMKEAEQRIRDRMPLVRHRLPKDIEEPIVRRFDPADMPVGILSFESDLPPAKAYDVAKEVAKPRLSRIPGIGVVEVFGGAQREIRQPERARGQGGQWEYKPGFPHGGRIPGPRPHQKDRCQLLGLGRSGYGRSVG